MTKFVLILILVVYNFEGFTQFYESEYENAMALQEQKKFVQAIDMYTIVLDNDSLFWQAWGNRGICYALIGNVQKAQNDFEKALKISPNEPSLNLAVADFYAGEGMEKRAIEHYQNAQKYGATFDAISYFNYGSIYYVLGVKDSAVLYLERSWEMDSTNSGVVNNLGWTYLETEPEKSCNYFKQAYLLDSLNASNVNNLGYSHLMCGNLETAFKFFEMSEAIDSTNSFVYRNYGLYYMYKGEKKLACENLQIAIDYGIVEKWGDSYTNELEGYCEE